MRRMFQNTALATVIAVLWVTASFGQTVLPNDTLYIGRVTGSPGQHVMVPITIKTSDYYQGWTIPLKFGNGSSPLVCDSVSFSGTIMENWAWKSSFLNNNQWDGVQTCGATGLYVWAGDSMSPGYYLALKLFFGIPGGTPQQTIVIDTTTCSFAQGGQQNNYIVVVHTQSWRTIVEPGSVTIGSIGIEETDKNDLRAKGEISPSILKRGNAVKIRIEGTGPEKYSIRIFDASGRIVDNIQSRISPRSENEISYSTGKLANGVYLIALTHGGKISKGKIIVE